MVSIQRSKVRPVWAAAGVTLTIGAGALGWLGSDRWVQGGYSGSAVREVATGSQVTLVGDEGFWLQHGAGGLLRVLDRAAGELKPGERLQIDGPGRPEVEVLQVTELSGAEGAGDERFLLVTARDTAPGRADRTIRFVIAEPTTAAPFQKAL